MPRQQYLGQNSLLQLNREVRWDEMDAPEHVQLVKLAITHDAERYRAYTALAAARLAALCPDGWSIRVSTADDEVALLIGIPRSGPDQPLPDSLLRDPALRGWTVEVVPPSDGETLPPR